MGAICEDCKKEVSVKVEVYSKEHFGKVLCVPCQNKVRAGEGGDDKKEEENKGTLDGFDGGAKASDDELEEYDREVGTELEAEAKELNVKIIELVTAMSMEDKEGFYRWLKTVYGVDDLETLNIDQKKAILGETKKLSEMRDEKGERKKGEVVEPEVVVEPKQINIDWDHIPVQILIPKLKKALEYTREVVAISGVHRVKSGDMEYNTTIKSCECGNWAHDGSSINPCKHMIRVKYSDEEIRDKLKELGAENLPVKARKKEKAIVSSDSYIASDMMIQGLTPRLAEVGKIKIGTLSDKIVRGRRLPEKLDHFVVTSLLRDENGDLLIDEEISKKIGNDCRELPIYLCYDNPQLNMPTFFAHFTQSRLRCMGDGIKASRTMEEGGKEEIVCNPKTCDVYQQKKCKPYGRLSVILADASRIGGCYVLRTTSWNSIRNILTSMTFIKTITGGILAGIKLKMSLIPMQVQPRDMGRTVKIYTVNIEYDGSWDQLKDVAAQEMQRRLQLGTNMKQIEAGEREVIAERVVAEAEEQAAEISEEFAPEEEK